MNLKYRARYNMWRLCPYNDRCYHSWEKFYTSLTHSIYLIHWKKIQVSIFIHFWLRSNVFHNETVQDGQLELFLSLDGPGWTRKEQPSFTIEILRNRLLLMTLLCWFCIKKLNLTTSSHLWASDCLSYILSPHKVYHKIYEMI